jgi:HAD superfamily hydrolase (TIGR01484 family)
MSNFSKKLAMFDLDGTLTKSKSPINEEISDLICKLLTVAKVGIISGGGYPQFLTQFVSKLPTSQENYKNLFLLPTSGTRMYTWKGEWHLEYAEDLGPKEKERIMDVLNNVINNSPVYTKPDVVYGDIIEDRGSQITFSALGQKAPVDAKYAWDKDRKKREAIADYIRKKIPEFDIRVGGATSVDITHKGVNKAYGIMKLVQFLKITIPDVVFVGDALFYGGNDYPAKSTGADCVQVNGPEDTAKLIRSWLE